MFNTKVSSHAQYYHQYIYPYEPIIKAHTCMNYKELRKFNENGKRKYNILTLVLWHNQLINRHLPCTEMINQMEQNTTYRDAIDFLYNINNQFSYIHGAVFNTDYTNIPNNSNYIISHPHVHIYLLIENQYILNQNLYQKMVMQMYQTWLNTCYQNHHSVHYDFFAGPLYVKDINPDDYVLQFKSNYCDSLNQAPTFHKIYGFRPITSQDTNYTLINSCYYIAKDVSKYEKREYPFYQVYLRDPDFIYPNSYYAVKNVPFCAELYAHKKAELKYQGIQIGNHRYNGLEHHYYFGNFKKDWSKFQFGLNYYGQNWINHHWLKAVSNGQILR